MPHKDLVATIRPLDDYSNTYIGLYVEDPTLGREILMVHCGWKILLAKCRRITKL